MCIEYVVLVCSVYPAQLYEYDFVCEIAIQFMKIVCYERKKIIIKTK